MKFDDFLFENNNKYVEIVDPDSPFQCFDLVVAWCDELLIPRVLGFYYAYQIFTDFSNNVQGLYFDRIVNTPDAIPQKGDIVVWDKTYNGTAGHTGIAAGKGDLDTFECFEQNDPTGSNSHLKVYKYNSVLGWLRPKVLQVSDTTMDRRAYWFDLINSVTFKLPHEQVSDQMVNDFVRNYTGQLKRSGLWDQLGNRVGLTGDSNLWTVDQVVNALQGQNDSVLAKRLSECQAQNEVLTKKLQGIKISLTNLANNL